MPNKTRLSVNINKIATLRNARGKDLPNLLKMTQIIIEAGAKGITAHPRPDERHIRYKDISQLKNLIKKYKDIEFNIEGYPSNKFLKLIEDILPSQCTLVPDPPDVLTSDSGWKFQENKTLLTQTVQNLKNLKVRSSLFLDPLSMNDKEWESLKSIAPDRIELYTEAYARSWNTTEEEKILSQYKNASQKAIQIQIEINAGHDLNQKNLANLLKTIQEIKEVSIGQSLVAESLEEGFNLTVKKYLSIIDEIS